jgi:membrane peptidoglycan carboxypeptidase
VSAFWAGNNDNKAMTRKTGGVIVAPAWSEFMQYALTKVPSASFTRAEYLSSTKPILNGIWQTPGSDGLIHEILYWVNKNDPTGPTPTNPASDSQFERWDAPVRARYGSYEAYTPPPATQTPLPDTSTQTQYQNPYGGSLIPIFPTPLR